MKFRTALLGLLLSLAGSVLGFVSARGKLRVHGFSVPPKQLTACGIHCGTERWSVKTLSDADREKVDFTPKERTVASLVSQKSAAYLPADRRVAPVETQTYKVRANLVDYRLEQDDDIHLVINRARAMTGEARNSGLHSAQDSSKSTLVVKTTAPTNKESADG